MLLIIIIIITIYYYIYYTNLCPVGHPGPYIYVPWIIYICPMDHTSMSHGPYLPIMIGVPFWMWLCTVSFRMSLTLSQILQFLNSFKLNKYFKNFQTYPRSYATTAPANIN